MKQIKRTIILMLICSLCFVTGCQSEKKKYEEMGLTFYKISSLSGYRFLETYEGNKNAYLCQVNHSTLETLEIPATYNKKPVVALTSSNQENQTLKTLVLPEGLLYLTNAFNQYKKLSDVTFPSSLVSISDSFKFASLIKEVILPLDRQAVKDSFSSETQVIYGDKDIVHYCREVYNTDELIKQAKTHVGETFDDSLKINRESASSYADRLNGPLVVMDRCPECLREEFTKEKLPKNLTLDVVNVYTFALKYPDTIYTKEKAEKVLKEEEPFTYCLVEMLGYKTGPKYLIGGTGIGSYLCYRLSLWDQAQDRLIAWFEVQAGYAPSSFVYGRDKITFNRKVGEEHSKSFFLASDKEEPTESYVVNQYFFPRKSNNG